MFTLIRQIVYNKIQLKHVLKKWQHTLYQIKDI